MPLEPFDELRDLDGRISVVLRESAEELEEHGRPVSSESISHLDRLSRLLEGVGSEMLGPDAVAGSLSFERLRDERERLEARAAGRRLLDHLVELEHLGHCEPFERLRTEWASLLDRVDSGVGAGDESILPAMARAEHPWRALGVLTGFGGEPNDDEWESAHEVVRAELGAEIATAAARRRLARRQTHEGGSEAPEREPARGEAKSVGSIRSATVEDVYRLVGEDRPALAAHRLACDDEDARVLPLWLPRLLALAPRLRGPGGTISKQIERVLEQAGGGRRVANVARELSSAESAHALLVRAAALWPSLVTPEVGTPRILRTLHRGEVDASIEELCALVCEFGDRSGGLGREGGNSTDDLRSVSAAASAWFRGILDERLQFARSRPTHQLRHWTVCADNRNREEVVRTWRETCDVLSFVRTRLQPVFGNEQFAWVEVEDAVRELRRRPESPAGEIVAKAIDHAERWLSGIRTATVGRSRAGSTEIDRLQESLSSVWSPVLENLDDLQRNGSANERVAARVLVREVVRVRDQLNGVGSAVGHSAEPSARVVLNGELLAIEGLKLDDDWNVQHPQGDSLRERLVEHVVKGTPDWALPLKRAFEAQDLRRVERLLELDVWTASERTHAEHELDRLRPIPDGDLAGPAEPVGVANVRLETAAAVSTIQDEAGDLQGDGWILDVFDDDEAGGVL